MATIMDKLQALLDEQDAERELEEAHARRMFNLSARTTITVQQLEAARKAINRAKECLKVPKTHTNATERAFHPEKRTYSEWYAEWQLWVEPLHPIQKRMILIDVHIDVPRVKAVLNVTMQADDYVEAEANNDFEEMYQLLINAVASTQNKQVWTQMEKQKFETNKAEKGVALISFLTKKRT